ncbi:MAG: lipoyl protein ligase domain-containing protein [Acidimicrobiales bacterium]
MTVGWRVDERVGDAGSLHERWPAAEHRPDQRAVAVCRPRAAAVVLGSTQPGTVVDGSRAQAAGVAVVKRRSGGGAVLVGPGEPAWVDVWVPAGDDLWHRDVGRAFDWLGDVWVAALRRVGVAGVVAHRGAPRTGSRWSSLVCFGGVGSGEVVTDDGRKVVGLAQRRVRQGTWFHGACVVRWDPRPLVALLALTRDERASAAADLGVSVVGVADLAESAGAPPVDAATVVSTFLASLP